MRTRKPWDLARFLFFGLYVNDMQTTVPYLTDKFKGYEGSLPHPLSLEDIL